LGRRADGGAAHDPDEEDEAHEDAALDEEGVG
jgi:hypothetical protein